MQFFAVLMMAASVAAVALPGNDWNQWSSSCPPAQTVYKTETQTVTQPAQTVYKTETQTVTQPAQTVYKTEYQTVTQVQYKTETQYATVTKECEKEQQTWGSWNGKA